METEKEKMAWKIAKRRVEFKRHLSTYLVINAMFWVLWYFSEGQHERSHFLP